MSRIADGRTSMQPRSTFPVLNLTLWNLFKPWQEKSTAVDPTSGRALNTASWCRKKSTW